VGITPYSLDVGVNPAGLTPGTYTGDVYISTGLFGSVSQQHVVVTLTVALDSRPSITSVINAASFKPTVGPGTWVSIIGKNLATITVQVSFDTLPTTFAGVSVQLSGTGAAYNALIEFVSPTQINAFLPHEVSPALFEDKSAQLTVNTIAGTVSVGVDCEALSPGLFSYGPNNYAAAVFPDGVIVGATAGTRPVAAGSVISLFGTGFGQTVPPVTNVNGSIT
jgi:uncharacterized protein (TIGR03437 family)